MYKGFAACRSGVCATAGEALAGATAILESQACRLRFCAIILPLIPREIGNMDCNCAGILPAQPSQKRDAQFPNTKQAMVRVSHELHRNNFMMSNLRRGVIHGTRDA